MNSDTDTTPGLDAKYISEDGRVVTKENIGYYIRYENGDVEPVDDGFIIDGEHYQRITDQ